MSTTDRPSLAHDHERIRSPLGRLRKFIAGYVSLEGATLVALFLALWFWIGLTLDYGAFRVFLVDWVQWLPMWLRASFLGTILLALAVLVVLVVLVRLLVSFTDAALALVLERRFPDKLGDRLITAVELADPQQVAAIGYSPALVRETIREAAQRVDEVPVGQVFDWRRLALRGLLFVGLTLGLYLLVGAGFCAARAVRDEGSPMVGYSELGDVSRIWFDRNVLLRNTIWPRRAHLEIVDFPDDLRIAANSSPPSLRVRAWKYVVAAPDAPEGWRPLGWAQVGQLSGSLGLPAPPAAPAEWQPRAGALTVDEVEQAVSNFPVADYRALKWSELTADKLGGVAVPGLPPVWGAEAAVGLAGLLPGGPIGAAGPLVAPAKSRLTVGQVEALLANAQAVEKQPAELLANIRKVVARARFLQEAQAVVEAVDAAASDRANRRTLRKLIVPGEVILTYSGRQTENRSTLTPVAGNEFTGNFGDLKETITFRVRGEDYETPRQTVVVVERPRVERIESQEDVPSYLFYREHGEVTSTFLRDNRQPLRPKQLPPTSDLTSFDVPTGTHVNLTLTMNKPLNSAKVVPDAQFVNLYAGEPLQIDGRVLKLRLPNLRREQRFTIQYLDEDDVPGERKFILMPRDDTAPRVREFVPDEVVGKAGKEGYVVSAMARVPFRGRVSDDLGLARVRFAVRVTPADALGEQKIRSLLMAGAVPLAAPGQGGPLHSVAYIVGLNRELAALGSDEGGHEQFLDIPGFIRDMTANRPGKEEPLELLPLADVRERLGGRREDSYRKLFREFGLTPDPWMQKFAEQGDEDRLVSRWIKADEDGSEGRPLKAPLHYDLPLWKLKYRHVEKDALGKVVVDELRSIVASRQPRRKDLKEGEEPPQRRYQVEVRLVVDDNYATGEVDAAGKPIPHTTSSDTHTFVVVPANELLSRVAGEEDQLYRDLVKVVKPIGDAVDRAREMTLYLSGGGAAGELNNFRARTVDMIDGLQSAHADTRAVYQTYEQLLKRLRLNQVPNRDLDRVYTNIFKPLQEAALSQFDQGINAVKSLRATLDDETQPVAARVKGGQVKAREARDRLMELQRNINNILAAMEGLSKLNELVAEIVRIERAQEDLETLWRALYRIRFDEQFKKDD